MMPADVGMTILCIHRNIRTTMMPADEDMTILTPTMNTVTAIPMVSLMTVISLRNIAMFAENVSLTVPAKRPITAWKNEYISWKIWGAPIVLLKWKPRSESFRELTMRR